MTGQYLIQRSIYQQTGRTLLERPITALHPGKWGWLLVHRAPLFFFFFSLPVILSTLFANAFVLKKGGASRTRAPAVGARAAQRTAGSPAPAVLQPDAMPVGLDTEADRCHLKGNQITWKEGNPAFSHVWIPQHVLYCLLFEILMHCTYVFGNFYD